jgi:hypothetical protein
VGMTMDMPSAERFHVIPGLPDARTSRHNYFSSNYAFWEI